MPPETDVLSFKVHAFVYGIVLPALVSGAVLFAGWCLRRRGAVNARVGGVAVGAGYIVGQVGVDGLPPPALGGMEATHWIWCFTLAAVLLGLLDAWRSQPAWLRGALSSALWLGLAWVLLPPRVREHDSAVWLLALGGAGLAYWAALDLSARRMPGPAVPLALFAVAAGSVVVLFQCHSAKLAQLAGVGAAALLPVLARALCRPSLVLATAPVMVILPGLWLAAYFYTEASALQKGSLLLLAAAALSCGVGCLPGVRRLRGWQRALLSTGLACGLVAAAVLTARSGSVAEEGLGL